MKRKYIKPKITLDNLATNIIMDTFSLPNTGLINDPSLGQANDFDFDEDDDNNPSINIWDKDL